jgi:hypothetical protein
VYYYWQEIKWEDYYKILGLPREASEEEIRQVIRGYEIGHHPDPLKDPRAKKRAEAAFKVCGRAKDTLLNPSEKFDYDRAYDARIKTTSASTGPKASTGSKTTSGPTSSPSPTPPPKVYEPILEVSDAETLFDLAATEDENVSFNFTVHHVDGELPPHWKLGIRTAGGFLDDAQIALNPKNAFPTRVSVTIPYARVGDYEGSFEVFVVGV